jgi:hypothetical protein
MCFDFSGCHDVEQSRRLALGEAQKPLKRLMIWHVTYANVRDSQHALTRN